jgi:hypothetical protein
MLALAEARDQLDEVDGSREGVVGSVSAFVELALKAERRM